MWGGSGGGGVVGVGIVYCINILKIRFLFLVYISNTVYMKYPFFNTIFYILIPVCNKKSFLENFRGWVGAPSKSEAKSHQGGVGWGGVGSLTPITRRVCAALWGGFQKAIFSKTGYDFIKFP